MQEWLGCKALRSHGAAVGTIPDDDFLDLVFTAEIYLPPRPVVTTT